MGAADVTSTSPLWDVKFADLVAISAIIANIFVARWVVVTIQRNQNNARILKDHFIGEVKEIRKEYSTFLNELYYDKINAKQVIPWFKLMDIRVNDLMIQIDSAYKINLDALLPFQTTLPDLITNNQDFNSQFNTNSPVQFSASSKNDFVTFQQSNNHLFHDVIVSINNA